MVLKACKWYHIVRLVMTRQLVSTVTFLGQTLKLTYQDPSTILLIMTSGDLHIDLTKKKVITKVVGLSTNYQTPFAVYCYDSWFSRSERGPKRPLSPPRFRAFQSPLGIGFTPHLTSVGYMTPINWTTGHPMILNQFCSPSMFSRFFGGGNKLFFNFLLAPRDAKRGFVHTKS